MKLISKTMTNWKKYYSTQALAEQMK